MPRLRLTLAGQAWRNLAPFCLTAMEKSRLIDGKARRDLVVQASGRSRKRHRVRSFGSVLSSSYRDRRLRRSRAAQCYLRR